MNSLLAILSLFLPYDESAFQKYGICRDFEVAKIWIIFYLLFSRIPDWFSHHWPFGRRGRKLGVHGGTRECGRNLWKMQFSEGPLLWKQRGLDLPIGPSSWWYKSPRSFLLWERALQPRTFQGPSLANTLTTSYGKSTRPLLADTTLFLGPHRKQETAPDTGHPNAKIEDKGWWNVLSPNFFLRLEQIKLRNLVWMTVDRQKGHMFVEL